MEEIQGPERPSHLFSHSTIRINQNNQFIFKKNTFQQVRFTIPNCQFAWDLDIPIVSRFALSVP
jgi:hypothetical protein